MNMAKVVITDTAFDTVEPERKVLFGLADIVLSPSSDIDTLIALTQDADAILNCYAPLAPTLIQNLTRCKIIARYGIGLDTIPIEIATEAGIMVTNVPDYCVNEVADHALALLLNLARRIPQAQIITRRGQWGIQELRPVHRLQQQVLALIGFGRIARTFAKRAQAVGLNIIGYDPFVQSDDFEKLGVQSVNFEIALKEADFLSLHLPLSAQTYHIINEAALSLMKPTGYLINTSRGGLVDTNALIAALSSRLLAGAGLDVLEQEPPPSDLGLLHEANVILTPHSGFYSEEAMTESQVRAAGEVALVLRGEQPVSLANPEVLLK